MYRTPSLALCITLVWTLLAVAPAQAQPGTVLAHQKISDTQGDFGGELSDADSFGSSVALLGDLDGDGIGDIVVGARDHDDGGKNRGAVWVLFLEQDGTVKSDQKIGSTDGGFAGILHDGDWFGFSVVALGDLDGDGVGDLAVGANSDDDGGGERGSVWVLFLNTDGTVKAHQKISNTAGGFEGTLDDGDSFGSSVASLGDLDGDGVGDLVVGAPFDNDGGTPPDANRGAVWLLFLHSDGTVKSEQKISDIQGGFGGVLDDGDEFGFSVASLGDLDGDGVVDLAVGANAGNSSSNPGAVWIVFLNNDGSVKSEQKLSEGYGGYSVASLGDLDGDGVGDLAVGAPKVDDGGTPPNADRGAVRVLFLNNDGTVKAAQTISDEQGGFTGVLDDRDWFGTSVASLGDLDGDGVGDLAVGAPSDDDGGTDRGAVWLLFLDGIPADCDGDGIPDIEETDTDGDGIIDDCDSCPLDNPDDTDGDGVCDSADNCELFNPDQADCQSNGVGDVCDLDDGTSQDCNENAIPDECDISEGTSDDCDANGTPDECEPCSGDLDCNGIVDAFDLAVLLGSWGPCDGCPADIFEDGDVNAGDLAILLGNWGPCEP